MVASYNGWKASQKPAEIGIVPLVVNGVSFPSGARGGDIGVIFRYLAEQFAKRVEPLITPGCWGYYYKQSANSAALLSCHSSGTAIDFNAPKHPNGKRGTFTAAQVKAIRAILAELGGVVYWGGDAWGDGVPDEMHFEIKTGVTASEVAAVANKIRGGTPTPTTTGGFLMALTDAQQAQLAADAQAALAELRGPNWREGDYGHPTERWAGDQEKLTVAQFLQKLDRQLNSVLTLANRPVEPATGDNEFGHVLSARAEVEALAARVAKVDAKLDAILAKLDKA